MATLEQLHAGLIKADAAGNTDDARAFASEIRKMQADPAPAQAPETSLFQDVKQGAGNVLAGLTRGAGSIGATLLAPKDMLMDAIDGKGLSLESNRARRAAMDSALGSMGAETDSFGYGAGKLAGEIAGTAGMGGVIAKPLQALAASKYAPGIEPLLEGGIKALQTGGFRVGPLAGTGAGTAARVLGGAAVGGASAGLVNPEDTTTGAIIGGALPGVAQLAGKAGGAIRQSLTGGGVAPEVAQLANRAKELGINIPADRLVNSRPMNALAAGLNYVPMSGRAATEDAMGTQLNRALSRTFGQDSPNINQALNKAGDALGGKFDDFLRSNTVKVDAQFMNDLAEASNQASRELGSDGAKIIGNQIDEILAKGANSGPRPGVKVDLAGDFLKASNGFGYVGGKVKDGALFINSAEIAQAARGKGHGVDLYRSLVDDAHSKGLKVFSDSAVEKAAANVYEALGRRGYEVKRLGGGVLEDGAVYGSNGPAFEVGKKAVGEIDGQAAYNIKKTLDRIGKRNSPEAHYAIDLKQKLMDALNRSVGEEKAGAFATVRKQYGNMLSLEKLAKNGAEGDISVARLANMRNINNPDMQELADIAAQFVKPRESAHGGAQRALVGALGFGAGGLPGLAGGMVAGRGANSLLNSNAARNYLLNGGGLLAEPETMGLLTQGVYRAAPLLGGSR